MVPCLQSPQNFIDAVVAILTGKGQLSCEVEGGRILCLCCVAGNDISKSSSGFGFRLEKPHVLGPGVFSSKFCSLQSPMPSWPGGWQVESLSPTCPICPGSQRPAQDEISRVSNRSSAATHGVIPEDGPRRLKILQLSSELSI
eukprot:5323955-Amphidinium_carterae.1